LAEAPTAEKIGCSSETLRGWVCRTERDQGRRPGLSTDDRARLKELADSSGRRYTERLAEAGIEPSVGSKGDSYDNALAESVIGLFKAEVIRQRGPWRSLEDVECAVLEWVWWFNQPRLLESLGYLPPVEYEAAFHKRTEGQALEAVRN